MSDHPARRRTALLTVFDETGRIGTRSGESFGEAGADGEIVWTIFWYSVKHAETKQTL